MATTLQKPTARPRPRRIWVADPLPSLEPLPGLCGVCGLNALHPRLIQAAPSMTTPHQKQEQQDTPPTPEVF
jgi:hypothetical protein